jgi:two-component system, LytTR family, sensor kinase
MRNVRERMEVLYGDLASVEINSRPGRGTKVTLLMPILAADAETWAQDGREAIEAARHMLDDAVRVMTRNR